MTERRTDRRRASCARTDRPLSATRAASPAAAPRVVPLTGDASDRRYFRVLLGRRPIDRARAARRADRVRDAAVRQRRRAASARCRCPSRDPRPLRRRRHPRAPGSRRRDAAGAPRRRVADRARGAVPRGRRARSSCCSGAAPSSRRTATCPIAIAFDVEKLTWELDFFVRHFVEGYRGVALTRGRARGARRGVGGDRRRARRRAARALPSRLPQPQPDAARRAAVHHRLPGRAAGARHLRSGVAAARFVRGPHRPRARRARSRTSWR